MLPARASSLTFHPRDADKTRISILPNRNSVSLRETHRLPPRPQLISEVRFAAASFYVFRVWGAWVFGWCVATLATPTTTPTGTQATPKPLTTTPLPFPPFPHQKNSTSSTPVRVEP